MIACPDWGGGDAERFALGPKCHPWGGARSEGPREWQGSSGNFAERDELSEAKLSEVPRGNPKGKTDPATEQRSVVRERELPMRRFSAQGQTAISFPSTVVRATGATLTACYREKR